MIPAQVIQRVFSIRAGNNFGSCFVLDVENKQYVCTAKHILDDWDGKFVLLFHRGEWKHFGVNLVGFGSENTDIAVLAPSARLVPPDLPLQATMEGLIYGQDAYFLGFPAVVRENLEVTSEMEINRFFPLPFVKRATVSIFCTVRNQSILFLDGHNNHGFSGGPVAFKKQGSGPNEEWCAAAVIFAYQPEPARKAGNREIPEVFVNAGIVIAYDIKHALDAIQENPVGLDISSS